MKVILYIMMIWTYGPHGGINTISNIPNFSSLEACERNRLVIEETLNTAATTKCVALDNRAYLD